jgi:2,3-bisphosphoglycerate-dependent phosphoglycerate mutase
MLNKIIVTLFLTAFTISNFNAFAQTTTIWLVRHAEKSTANAADRDPELSAMGTKRAADLAQVLGKEQVTTIYSTNYKRTLATAQPLASALKLIPVVYDAKDLNGIANKALQENKGKTALIVGHSNTIIPVVKALNCVVPFEELTDEDYDMLFKVIIDKDGKATLTISHYGEAHHTTDPKSNKPPVGTRMMGGK